MNLSIHLAPGTTTVKAGTDAGPATGGQQSSQAQEPKLASSTADTVTSKAQSSDLDLTLLVYGYLHECFVYPGSFSFSSVILVR